MSKINLQLYSVAEIIKNDVLGTLTKLSEMGFTGVEFAGYYGFSAEKMKEELDKRNLTPVSTHLGIDALSDNLKGEIDYIKKVGAKHIVCPWLDISSYDKTMTFAEKINEIGRICREEGITLSYHNHAFEFETHNGKTFLDIFFENTNPDYVKAELDTYWVEKGGFNAYEYVEKYKERSELVHLKQYRPGADDVDADDGVLDFNKIIELSGGCTGIYEQEGLNENELFRIEKSCKYLIKEL